MMNKKILILTTIIIVLAMSFLSGCEENVGGQAYTNNLDKETDFFKVSEENFVICDNTGEIESCIISSSPYQKIDQDKYDKLEREFEIEKTQELIKRDDLLWEAKDNKFSDLTNEEKERMVNGLIITEEETIEIEERQKKNKQIVPRDEVLPDFFDWRNLHGNIDYVTPVKDQASCGSCWAFGGIGALEAGINAYYNNPDLDFNLSEQDLVSCYLGDGCSGATSVEIESMFSDYFQNTGVTDEQCFPYSATNNVCSNKCVTWQENAWKTASYESPDMTVEDIKSTIIEHGPVDVGMKVYEDFMSYDNGIYNHVTGDLLGYHSVLIVGFGVYDGADYWIVKNSWGEDWGENGYFRIFTNECWINSLFAYTINQPEYLVGPMNPEKICTDSDNDGFCYWGLGNKPNNCPTCDNLIYDCDDSNSSVFENCGQNNESTGILSVNASEDNAQVYVRDLNSSSWIYRGITPTQFNLNVGAREIKTSKFGFHENITIINISENLITELNITLIHDSQFQEGWPVQIPYSFKSPGIAVGNIDNSSDGSLEIVAIAEDNMNSHWIYVFDNEGNILEGWPKSHTMWQKMPLLADLNNDGNLEIIVQTNGINAGIKIWNLDGSLFSEIIIPGLIFSSANPAIGNLDEDEDLEIVAAFRQLSGETALYVWDYDGSMLEGQWPILFPNPCCWSGSLTPILADIDNDNYKDIIFVTNDNDVNSYSSIIHIFNRYGSYLPNWPFSIEEGWPVTSPIVADLNKDGNKEIIGNFNNYVYVLNSNGTNFNSNWPKDLIISLINPPSIADVNNNGKLEIIVKLSSNRINILDYETANNIVNWPRNGQGFIVIGDLHQSQVVIGDIDNDNNPEIISGIADLPNPILMIRHSNGSIMPGWPKELELDTGEYYISNSPVIADIDNDGQIEIIVAGRSGTIYIWNQESYYNQELQPWPQYQHDAQHTGNYPSTLLTCSDNTHQNSCSETQPIFCNNDLELIDNCQECGCSEGECLENGSCTIINECIDNDGGLNYYEQSEVQIEEEVVCRDICESEISSSDTPTLNECYCNDEGGFNIAKYECRNGCFGGVCLEEEIPIENIKEIPKEKETNPVEEQKEIEETKIIKEELAIPQTEEVKKSIPLKKENIAGKAYPQDDSDNNFVSRLISGFLNLFR